MIGALAENMQQRTTSRARNHAPLTASARSDYVPPDIVEAAFARRNEALETACREAATRRLATKRAMGRGRR